MTWPYHLPGTIVCLRQVQASPLRSQPVTMNLLAFKRPEGTKVDAMVGGLDMIQTWRCQVSVDHRRVYGFDPKTQTRGLR